MKQLKYLWIRLDRILMLNRRVDVHIYYASVGDGLVFRIVWPDVIAVDYRVDLMTIDQEISSGSYFRRTHRLSIDRVGFEGATEDAPMGIDLVDREFNAALVAGAIYRGSARQRVH